MSLTTGTVLRDCPVLPSIPVYLEGFLRIAGTAFISIPIVRRLPLFAHPLFVTNSASIEEADSLGSVVSIPLRIRTPMMLSGIISGAILMMLQ